LFCLLAAMWVTKNPQFVSGWADLMGHKYVRVMIVLFITVTFCHLIYNK